MSFSVSLKEYFKKKIDKNSDIYYLLSLLKNRPLSFFLYFFYSIWLSKRLTGSWLPIIVRFTGKILPVKISLARGAKCIARGNLIIESFPDGKGCINIKLGENAILKLDGNLTFGQGVTIYLASNAVLRFGGVDSSSGSGITCNSFIMTAESIDIGKDVIIAWGVYITDSDWHEISGKCLPAPVVIGDHVWISHDVSVLKGSHVGNGSIIGAKSLVAGPIPSNCLAAGVPAKVVSENVSWTR